MSGGTTSDDSFEAGGGGGHPATADAMDISEWNDFDPSSLNAFASWNDGNNTETASTHEGSTIGAPSEHNLMSSRRKRKIDAGSASPSSHRLEASNWDGNLALLSNFGGIEYEGGGGSPTTTEGQDNMKHQLAAPSSLTHNLKSQRIPGEGEDSSSQPSSIRGGSMHAAAISEGASSVQASLSSRVTAASSVADFPTNIMNGTQLHPLAIQSSATCPPHSTSTSTVASHNSSTVAAGSLPQHSNGYTAQTMPAAGASGTVNPFSSDLFAMNGISPDVLASLTASLQNSLLGTNSFQQIETLAANFAAAQGISQSAQSEAPKETLQGTNHHSQQYLSQPQNVMTSNSAPPSHAAPLASRRSSHGQKKRKSDTPGSTAPPFYLFDAPVELRANFMQNQKRLGLPVHHDPNSYHFGKSVGGFHPQQLMNQQQVAAMVAASEAGNQHAANRIPDGGAPIQLIDARHGNLRSHTSGRVKNEREQRRAHKITELIEKIRLDMERGGWQVEMRSKFHTLSKCAEYIRHLIESTDSQEEAVNKLRSELEVKQRKIEEDKAANESRSDPESVTSSLTSDDTNRSMHEHLGKKQKTTEENAENSARMLKEKNMSVTSTFNNVSVSTTEDSSGGEDRVCGASGSGSGSGEPSAQGFSVEQTEMTGVSDLTDSNRPSSSNNSGSGSGDGSGNTESVSHGTKEDANKVSGNLPSGSSIISDAAVASEKSPGDDQNVKQSHNHKDVVVDHTKRIHRSSAYGVDYQEVFKMSNVPQLIATTSGRIVTWNKCFIKATGIRRSEVERMTIFSLVKSEQLSKFFEVVAKALKEDETRGQTLASSFKDGNKSKEDSSSCDGSSVSTTRSSFDSLTLPCIDFPAMRKRRENESSTSSSSSFDRLYVTLTLMTNVEDQKRCFHCMFSNCPPKNDKFNLLSPELLAAMYSPPEHHSKKQKRHHHRHVKSKRKRYQPKISQNEIPAAIQQDHHISVSAGEADDSEATVTDRAGNTQADNDTY